MGSFRLNNIGFQTSPPLPSNVKVSISTVPFPLMFDGLNIPVLISTASAYRSTIDPHSIKTAQILAHFDTGATKTSIDIELAKKLNLIPIGESPSHTAAGLRQATDFVIDLGFPSTNLRPFINLQISSCKLSNPNVPLKFQMLLGRDIMSHWNIVWDGPSSTVIISD
ncbi:pepsin/retropepsin-like aspartic protease family protein [Treponema sp. R80B11-R83G3]